MKVGFGVNLLVNCETVLSLNQQLLILCGNYLKWIVTVLNVTIFFFGGNILKFNILLPPETAASLLFEPSCLYLSVSMVFACLFFER